MGILMQYSSFWGLGTNNLENNLALQNKDEHLYPSNQETLAIKIPQF